MRISIMRCGARAASLLTCIGLFGPAHVTAQTQPVLMPSKQSTAPLSLAELEQIASERNPTLVQAAARIEMSRGKALQAGLYPNPTIGYEAEQMGLRGSRGSGWGERQGVFLQQEIVTAGKLRLSRAKYCQEVLQAEIQAIAQQLRVVTGIRVAYYEVLAAQRSIENHRTLAKNAATAVTITEELVNLGQANQPDVLQAQIESQRARVAVKTAEMRFRRAWEELATIVGAPDLAPTALAGKLEPDGPPLVWEEALGKLMQESPEMQIVQAEIVRDEITLRREQVEPIPNITVRGATGYNFENRSTTADLSVSLRLPIFDRNQGSQRQAAAELARAHAEVTRMQLVLRNRLAGVFSSYSTARESVEDFQKSTLPKARDAYNLYQEYFKKRRATMPQVLVAERNLSNLSEEYTNALLDMRRAEVAINGLLLTNGLDQPPAPTPQGHLEATPRPR